MDPVTLKLAKNYTDDEVLPKDLTGQASGDYIRNDAGVWKPLTLNEVLRDIYSKYIILDIPLLTFNETTSATGSADTPVVTAQRVYLRTRSTANSETYAQTSDRMTISTGTTTTRMNWSKYNQMAIKLHNRGMLAGANAQRWFIWGIPAGAAFGDPTDKCIGFRVDGTAIKGICHNGSALVVEDLATTINEWDGWGLNVVSHGDGNIDWYINGVLKASSAVGPTGTPTTHAGAFRLALGNGASAGDNAMETNNLTVVAEQ